MWYLCMNFQKLFDQNPQSDFFRVWTSFMFVDKDLWKLKLFLPNKTVTKCDICAWTFKSCLIKIHKVTSLEFEPVLCLLTKSLKVRTVFPKQNKMLYLWINLQKFFDQNPQRTFFRVWTSFMLIDKDLTYDLNIHLEKKQFLCQICNSAWNLRARYLKNEH